MLGDRPWSLISFRGLFNPGNAARIFFGSTFRVLASASSWLPSVLAEWMISLLRLLLLSSLGFAAWVKRFPNQDLASAFSFVVIIFSTTYAYYVHSKCNQAGPNACLSEKEKEIKEACERMQHNIRDMKKKNNHRVEILKAETQSAKDDVPPEKNHLQVLHAHDLVKNLTEQNKILEEEIRNRRHNAITASREFQRKLDEMEILVESLKIVEGGKRNVESQLLAESEVNEQLQKDVFMLQETIEVMGKQRKKLMENYTSATKEMNTVREENNKLRSQLLAQDNESREQYIGDIQEITQRLQTSLSSAKGKLSRVGGFLKGNSVIPF